MDAFLDDDDDALLEFDVDAVARRALASRANAGDGTVSTSARGGWGGSGVKSALGAFGGGARNAAAASKENLDDVPLSARMKAMHGGGVGEGGRQLTVTSMFAAAAGARTAPTTVLGEVRERLAREPRESDDAGGWRKKKVERITPAKRKHQSTLPKELMIRKTLDSRELEAFRNNLPPEALGERDASGLTLCPSVGGGEGMPMDPEAIQTYIYPAQVDRRVYQYEITRNALLTNSLVCLPTGLGKTLIAAVVMYNYYRWFPTGKIIFMAPTRPLVDQQMSACYNLMGIPRSDTVVLMGTTKKDDSGSRRDFWRQKRIFFCTPHTVSNDIANGDLDANQIVCVVVDEAHHARGQYPSAEVLRQLYEKKVRFRLLALTATPGQGLEEVQTVVKTLRVGRIDFRSDQDPDVTQYTHRREMLVEKVRPDQAMSHVQDMICDLLRPYCAKLASSGALGETAYRMQQFINNKASSGASRIEPPAWFTLQSARQAIYSNQQHVHNKGSALAMLDAAMELSKAYEFLLKLGAKAAFDYVEKRGAERNTTLLHRGDPVSKELVDLLRSMSSNGAHHSPKLDKLTSILKQHFKEATADTRVIIFTSYRESVKDIVRALREVPAGADNACRIKVAEFVGQGDTASGKKRAVGGDARGTKGQTQKEQKQTLADFRAGTLNTLVSTSIGEEGLDIPSVDLIFFFDVVDIIRAIQRMGRTGRARDGKVVILATEGKEYAKFTNEQKKYETLMNCLRVPGNHFQLEKNCPRIVPEGVTPVCQLALIEASPAEKQPKSKSKRHADPSKPRGAKAISNAADKLKSTPLDAASRAILYAYEYEGNALAELDITSATIFLSRPDPVYAIEHSDWSKALTGVMADLQGLTRVDPAGEALLGGPCAKRRNPAIVNTAEVPQVIAPTVNVAVPPQLHEDTFGDEDEWGNDWDQYPEASQDVPIYEAAIKTSQEVLEEFTQMSDPVPRRISMHSTSPKRRLSINEDSLLYVPRSPLNDAEKCEEALADVLTKEEEQFSSVHANALSVEERDEHEEREKRDRLSMPPPPPRMTPQSAAKASDATPSTGGSDLNFKRNVSRMGARVLMSQEVSPPADAEDLETDGFLANDEEHDDDVQIIDDEEAEEAPRRPRERRARPQHVFDPRKRRNFFIDDEADASEEEDEDEDEMSSGDERFIANTQDDDVMDHPGAHFVEDTPEEPPRGRVATRGNAPSRVQLEQTFAALGPRERRKVQDTPSPTQRWSDGTRSTSKYDSSFIDDGSDESPDNPSVQRPQRRLERDVDIVDLDRHNDAPPPAQTAEDMWGEFDDDEIDDWDDDGWGGTRNRSAAPARANDDGWGGASQQGDAEDDDW